jgi:hypothetical protein
MLAGEWRKVKIRYRSTVGGAMEPAEFVAALERWREEELRRKADDGRADRVCAR